MKKVEAKVVTFTSKAMPCSCRSSFQDEFYGAGRRLHNRKDAGKATVKNPEWTCTVCGTKKAAA